VIPSLGFGTWRLYADTAAEMVRSALEVGYRHIDTAQMYRNEAGVGSGIAAGNVDRNEIFLTTKVDNEAHEPDDLVASVHNSLDKLDTDYVDLLLIHWPVHYNRIGATMAALSQVHAEGLARHIGVSNFTMDQLDEVAAMAPLEVLQVECHPHFQQRELRRWCVEHDWAFTAYSPLGQGEIFESKEFQDIAASVGAPSAQVALAWLIGLDRVTAIPRSSDQQHLESNFKATAIELSAEIRAQIDELDSGQRLVDPDFAPWNQPQLAPRTSTHQ
jgi:2,5-diketo-D-gluconate reductase B